MDIISISLPDDLKSAVDRLVERSDFTGRSAVVRTALRRFLHDQEELGALDGTVDAVIVVTHDEDDSDLSRIQHRHDELITTQLHNHLADHGCLELFILRGDADKIRDLWQELQAADAVRHAELLTP